MGVDTFAACRKCKTALMLGKYVGYDFDDGRCRYKSKALLAWLQAHVEHDVVLLTDMNTGLFDEIHSEGWEYVHWLTREKTTYQPPPWRRKKEAVP